MRWKSPAWKAHMRHLNESKRKYPKQHGYKSRIYNIWKAMRFRCYYKSHEAYHRYHDRNIKVCQTWKNNFMAFREWALSSGYSSELTLERINNDGSYSPKNCTWATVSQQARNRINNLPPVKAFGESKTICQWAEDKRFNMSYRILLRRWKAKWNFEEALMIPRRSIRHLNL